MIDGTNRNAVTTNIRNGGTLFTTVIAFAAALGVGCSSDNKPETIGGPVTTTGGGTNGGSGGLIVGGSGGTGMVTGTGGASGTTTGGVGGTGTGGTAAAGTGGTSGSGTGGGTAVTPITEACPDIAAQLGTSCGSTAVGASVKVPNLLVVLDRSGSTSDTPVGFTTTIWDGLKTALGTALTATQDRAAFGLELFPYPIDPSKPILQDCGAAGNCCEMPTDNNVNVPVEAGVTATPKIIQALNMTGPGGGTPTAAALQRALNYYTSGAGASLSGEKYVLLATDGAPNCDANTICDAAHCTANIDGLCTNPATNCCMNSPEACLDTQAVINQLNALQTAGIKTFVVGVPGTENYVDVLNQFAIAGGVPKTGGTESYYRVDASGGVDALTQTFQDITTQLVTSCTINLSMPPPDPMQINVAIDCTILAQMGTDGTDGWVLQPDQLSIQIQGATCDYVQQGVQRIDVIEGCPIIVNPR